MFQALIITGKCTSRHLYSQENRPFLIRLLHLCQNESTCETIHMKICSAKRFISMRMKLVSK